MSDMRRILKQVRDRAKSQRNQARRQLKILAAALQPTGIASIRVDYNGAGDEGSVQDIHYQAQDGTEGIQNVPSMIVLESEPVLTDSVVEDIALSFLPIGWEINEGSYGTVTLVLDKPRVEVEHNQRHMETTVDEFDFDSTEED